MNAPAVRLGWEAELQLEYKYRTDKTRLVRSNRRGPLAVQRAFYPEGAVCHTYLLHPPGGVVGGDTLDIRLMVAPDAHCLITTPGATKFYRSTGAQSAVTQHLRVESKGALEWMPLENIFFPNTQAQISTHIELSDESSFIGWEINCLGRPANLERFDQGRISSNLRVYREGQPILFDRFATDGLSLIDAPVGLRGWSAQATFIATLDDLAIIETVQQRIESHEYPLLAGASLIDGLLCVRVLGEQSQTILKLLVEIWSLIRPAVVQRQACPPRIWAT